ncbi:hypothetical protein [Oceanobacillus salinisoli]|uniref:hypothetical protein n=1 Tax=Oceanobacillus salinisoli TaxID=2678611 RepID=UPI0012E1B819|nr:hypothetical protein [Oceanobacillus salinisoli]
METRQNAMVELPAPSQWGIHTNLANRPLVMGTLSIDTVTDRTFSGTVNFHGTPLDITGEWNESTREISFDTPYATFSGNLSIFDDPSIGIRHFILRGSFLMKPPSIQAGATGDWIATTSTELTGPPITNGGLPPVGAFTTTDLLF